MRHVAPAVDESRALEIVNRGWGARLRRLFWGPHESRAEGGLPRAELVWMPSYLVTIQLESKQGASEVTCNVDACSGSFALFQMHAAIAGESAEGDTFPPTHDEAEAESRAREELVKAILRRRSRAGKPLPGKTLGIELLSYPYWVYYYQRRRALIDIKVIDAATGRPVGNKIKLGILDAFKAAAKSSSGAKTAEGGIRGETGD